jgi:Icc-related predicted phosphoesterase
MTERPDSQLRLGVIADIHLAPAGTPATSWHGPIHGAQMRSRLREALACLSSEEVGAIVLLGDLTEGADRESMDAVLVDCAGLSRPTFVVPGNCDLGRDESALELACEAAGSPVELLNSQGTLLGRGLRIAGQPLAHVGGEIGASALPDTARWNGDATIWISHYPPLSRRQQAADAGVLYSGDLANSDAVAEALRDRGAPTIALHGHLHFRDVVSDKHLLQIGVPALAEGPHELVVVDVQLGNGLVVEVRTHALEARATKTARAPAFAPADGRWSYRSGTWRPESMGRSHPVSQR